MEAVNNIIPSLFCSSAHLEYFEQGQLKKQPFHLIYQDVAACVLFFHEQKFSPQTRIGIIGTNSYEFVVIDLACIAAGLVSVPFDPNGKYNYATLKKEYDLKVICTNIVSDEEPRATVFSFDLLKFKSVKIFHPIKSYQFDPNDILTIKFTSGSTQIPKAIEAKVKSANATIISVQNLFCHSSTDKILVFLPLHLLQQRYWIYSAILYNFDIILSSSVSVMRAIKESKPTVIMGVPFFYENMKTRFLLKNNESALNRLKLFFYLLFRKITIQWTTRSFIYAPFKDFWGGNIRYFWTGSAPSREDTLTFYQWMGIPLFQGYGMNETCIVSKNYFKNNKIGSVGKLLPNIEIKFDESSQILIRNINEVNDKYFKSNEEDNKNTFSNGYVITGDLGYMDQDSYLFISGRRKELIVLSSGKKINPTKIENLLRKSDLVSNCMIFAPDSLFLAALIEPSSKKISKMEIKNFLEEINGGLLPEERIFRFSLIDEPFSIENGMLTSQYKLKRDSIMKKYAGQVKALDSEVHI